MQRAGMKPRLQTQAGGKAKISSRIRRRLSATIVTRPDIISPSAGPKEVARKAKDCSGAKA
jgi:hypothetical protein